MRLLSNIALFRNESAEEVKQGMWLSEPSFWTDWSYQGMLFAKDTCILFALTGGDLANEVTHLDGCPRWGLLRGSGPAVFVINATIR